MEKRCLLGGIGCIWGLGNDDELTDTATSDNTNDGLSQGHDSDQQSDKSFNGRASNVRPSCNDHNTNGVPLMVSFLGA